MTTHARAERAPGRDIARALRIDFGPIDGDLSRWYAVVACVAEGLVQANLVWLRGPHFARSIAHHARVEETAVKLAAIRYEERDWQWDRGTAIWPVRAIGPMIESGIGNCLELACAHAAVARMQGRPLATVQIESRQGEAHAVVVHGKWRFDPSAQSLHREREDSNGLQNH